MAMSTAWPRSSATPDASLGDRLAGGGQELLALLLRRRHQLALGGGHLLLVPAHSWADSSRARPAQPHVRPRLSASARSSLADSIASAMSSPGLDHLEDGPPGELPQDDDQEQKVTKVQKLSAK